MKFISKNANLRLVLRPGIPAEPMVGRLATPGMYVLFQDGETVVNDPEYIKRLMAHPGLGTDFVAVSEEEEAALVARSSSIEPEHEITEVQFGHPGKSIGNKKGPLMSPELKKAVSDMAVELAMKIIQERDKKDLGKKQEKAARVTVQVEPEPETQDEATLKSPSKTK
jgi:hypothetical protein